MSICRNFNGKMRKFSANWLDSHPWLRYSVSQDGLYCAPCVIFCKSEKDKTFIHTAVKDWSNLGQYIKRHIAPSSNHHGCSLMAENYMDVKSGKIASISSSVSESHKTDVQNNRHILAAIIEVLVLCGKQNISIRGHTEERSNFIAILKSKATHDPILMEHIRFCEMDGKDKDSVDNCSSDSTSCSTKDNSARKVKYTSPEIQNELLSICAQQIQKNIVENCNTALCFGLMADESTDKSTKEQVSICLRFVHYDSITDSYEVREEFLTFVHATETTGEALAQLLLSTLDSLGIRADKMRAQGYDGAAAMSGKHRGVQARIRQQIPAAKYVHCKAHCLNLAIVHASNDPCIRTMMATVQEVAFMFDYSAKRLHTFQDELAEDADAQERLQRRTKLKTLCETRWTSRADALSTFKSAYGVVIHTLEHLRDNGDDKAGQLLASVMKFDFLIALVVAEHVLENTVPLCLHLQAVDCDMLVALDESRTVVRQFQDERADPEVWNALYNVAVDIGAEFEVLPWMPRLAQRQRNRANPPANSPIEYWQRALYYPFLDHIIQELTDRLLGLDERYHAQYLLPTKVHLVTQEIIQLIFDEYSADLNVNFNTFASEVGRWKTRWSMMDVDGKPRKLIDTLNRTSTVLYPSITKILVTLLTMPATTATAERSFSVMKRVKSYLRSTMSTERMSSIAILHVYREIGINIDEAIDTFASTKSRNWNFA